MLKNKLKWYIISRVISLIFFTLAVVSLLAIWRFPIKWIPVVSSVNASLFLLGMYFAEFFKDKTYFYTEKDAIKLCAKVFNLAKEEICSITGEGNYRFYENPKIKSALVSGVHKQVETRILFGPYFDIDSTTLLTLARDKQIMMRRVSKRKDIHCKIVDNEYVNIADIHNPMEIERSGCVERSVSGASKYKEMFEKWWQEAEDFDIVKELQKDEEELKRLILSKEDVDEERKGRNKEREFGFIKGVKEDDETVRPIPVDIEDIKRLKRDLKI